MTAPKKPTGAPVWFAHAHVLSADARAALVAALGFPADSKDPNLFKCLQQVEYWLGFYPGGMNAIDNAPSAGVFRKDLEAVKKSALTLLALLNNPDTGINPFTRDTLSAHFEQAVSMTGPDGIGKATNAAGALLIACDSALKALEVERGREKRETRGRKPKKALLWVISQFSDLYDEYALKKRQKRRQEFIRTALQDIGIQFKESAYGDGESGVAKAIRKIGTPKNR